MNPAMGVLVREDLPVEDVLYAVRAMIDTFCQHGNYQNRAKARTRHMQDVLGADGLRDAYLANFERVKAAGGLDSDLSPPRWIRPGTVRSPIPGQFLRNSWGCTR